MREPQSGWWRQLRKLLVLPMMSLSFCGTVSGSCDSLILRQYDQAYRNRLADELLKAGTTLQAFTVDAVELREQVRACRGNR